MKEKWINPLKYALKKLFTMRLPLKQHAFKIKKRVEACGSKAMASFLQKVSFLSAEAVQGINPRRCSVR